MNNGQGGLTEFRRHLCRTFLSVDEYTKWPVAEWKIPDCLAGRYPISASFDATLNAFGLVGSNAGGFGYRPGDKMMSGCGIVPEASFSDTTDLGRGRKVGCTEVLDEFTPPGWAEQAGLYRQVYRPYCATCHNAQLGDLAFASWGAMLRKKDDVKRAVCNLSMPHAELPYVAFHDDRGGVSKQGLLLASLGFQGC